MLTGWLDYFITGLETQMIMAASITAIFNPEILAQLF
jgi:hypothetical protein